MMLGDREIMDPAVDPDTRPYWDAARQGRFLLKFCLACGKAHYYPRPFCPLCGHAETEWREASGRGTIYSHAYMLRARTPYMAAYVTLEEGPTMLTNIVECEPEAVAVDLPVELVFRQSTGGYAVPMFRLVAASSAASAADGSGR